VNEQIEVVGALQNNLKGINLKLPLGELAVATGPGKFSLASDAKTWASVQP
jgi:excinuclease UvrABC ATPase subunit